MTESSYNISFVLPMYNESDNIEKTISAVKLLGREVAKEYEIVIVDDASIDGSADIVEALTKKDEKIRLFRLDKNTKFGGAFARGFKEASKDVILYMDSDLPVKIEDIKASLPLIREVDIVTGYSKIKKGETLKRKVISVVYNFIVQTLFGLNIKDINSGYKIVKRDVVKDIEFISKSPFVDVELFIHAVKKNSKIKQFGLVFEPRSGGKSYISSIPIILATFGDMLRIWWKKVVWSNS